MRDDSPAGGAESLGSLFSISGLDPDLDVNDITDVENLCRLCMNGSEKDPSLVMLDIYGKNPHSNTTIVDLFRDGLNINIKNSRFGMPTQVCTSCLAQLQAFTNFKMKSLDVDAKLQNLVLRKFELAEARALYGPALLDGETPSPSASPPCISSDHSEANISAQTISMVEDQVDPINISTALCSKDDKCNQHGSCVSTELAVQCCRANNYCSSFYGDFVDSSTGNDAMTSVLNISEAHTQIANSERNCEVKSLPQDMVCPPENEQKVGCPSGASNYCVFSEAVGSPVTSRTNNKYNVNDNSKPLLQNVSLVPSKKKPNLIETPDIITNVYVSSRREYCSTCNRSFDNVSKLRKHLSTHFKQKGATCSVCNKWFKGKNTLTRHERIHSGVKPFKCVLCDRDFTQKEILQRHVLTHSDAKPFACSICDKSYTQKEGLASHIKLHHQSVFEIRQFPCLLCDKAFCHPSGLSRHMMVHSGKQFVCEICDRSFTDVSSFRRHKKTQHASCKEQTNKNP
ncbi:Zinc finger and BTB domain-containing protein 17 [Frankliniella fusca]|uniref:Zinc finger and BTB domain-containing protein 17 n=1 Tax=Frankliniella fusca TaxID=407009 RepID=A0AAE1HIH5_9NEOP|nr:Zinc finger and BTB domain-containing protein 17 [Frankliniella fusca]